MQKTLAALLACAASALPALAQTRPQPAPQSPHSVRLGVIYRSRVEAWQWFAAPPATNTYAYVDSLLRLSLSQSLTRWDWKLELSQPAILAAPSNAVSPIPAAGQLGLGATYYASGGNTSYPAAAFFKEGYLRYRFSGADQNIRLGRFEFFDGLETHPENPTLAWLQTNRIAQRLIGNFGFTNAQRSFDGLDAHYGSVSWDITAMAARADQGVFNMNGNPELNVDTQYLAFTRRAARERLLWRAFAIAYHDGRTGLTKTDNRPLAVRQADHHNIRLGTYGGNIIAVTPGPIHGQLDFLAWGAYQNGNWGTQSDRAGAGAIEAGYQLTSLRTTPWLRAGWFSGTGDNNPYDNRHTTFFQLLPTPRGYCRLPFFNFMNTTYEFISLMDKPQKNLVFRSDLHWLQLTSSKDLWYLGGGAYDNKVFGFTGRPSNSHSSLGSLADISADWAATRSLSAGFYYGYAWGKSVAAAIYPTGRNAQFAFVEMDYHWGAPLSK